MAEAIKAIQIRLNLSRTQALVALIVINLLVYGFLAFRGGAVKAGYEYAWKTEVEVNILDNEDSKPLKAQVFAVNTKNSDYKASGIADENGKIILKDLVRGEYEVKVIMSEYKRSTNIVSFNKRNDSLTTRLTKTPPEQLTLTTKVINYISELPIGGVDVKIDGQPIKSDASGDLSIEKLTIGEHDIAVSQKGYLDYSKKITLKSKEDKLENISLVPEGRVVFSSNRDGKRGIYVANYDGSDNKNLLDRKGDKEDINPIQSPDKKWVAFLSNREGKKVNGEEVNGLYIVDITGKTFLKVADVAEYSYSWQGDSKYLVWQYFDRTITPNKWQLNTYEVAKRESKVIATSSNWINFQLSNTKGNKFAFNYQDSTSYKHIIGVFDTGSGEVNNAYEGDTSYNLISFNGDDELIINRYVQNKQQYYKLTISSSSITETEYSRTNINRLLVKSPDGRKVAFMEDRDGKRNVFLANPDESNEQKLTSLDSVTGIPEWSLDSKLIFFNVQKTGESALYVVSVDGGAPKKIVDIAQNGYGGYGY